MNTDKLKDKAIYVFFGGQSPEHDISIITGEFVLSTLKTAGYNAKAVYVSKDGSWYIDPKINKLNFFKEKYEHKLNKLTNYSIRLFDRKSGILTLESNNIFRKKILNIEYAFPAFHGKKGEDGDVQGLYEFFNVPYAGCGVYTSSITINKIYTKSFLRKNDFTVTDYIPLKRTDWEANPKKIESAINTSLKYPIFVKPATAGSSIGISKVNSKDELKEALDLAFYYDADVIVENGVENLQDLTCAVLSDGKEIISSKIQESSYSDEGFLSYDDKYVNDGGTQTGEASDKLIIPANIPEEITNKIQDISKNIFRKLYANGTLRVDFLYNKLTKELFVNEINTLPGTLYHHLWEKSDINILNVIEKMIKNGLLRYEDEISSKFDFKSDVLNEANSMKLQQPK